MWNISDKIPLTVGFSGVLQDRPLTFRQAKAGSTWRVSRTSCRREMAQRTVAQGVSIKLACLAFSISQTCFRYQAKQSAENVKIADLLIRLTHNQRNWGFGLCFLYLRNVKGHVSPVPINAFQFTQA